MALAASKSQSAGGVGLKERFKAWWGGDVLPPRPDAPDDVEPARTVSVPKPVPEGEAAPAETEEASPEEWTTARKDLAEAIWGGGFVCPGGTEYVEHLVSGCSLTSAETMLKVGVGLGGGSRAIIAKFGNYITGFESNALLVEEARKQAIAHDIDNKLKIDEQTIENCELKQNYFRAALLRDALYKIEAKEATLVKVCNSLKEGQSFLIMTDFMFDEDNDSPELAAWKVVEKNPVFPWTPEALKSVLEANGTLPRIVEDESERYCAMIKEAWTNYMETLQGTEPPPELGNLLMEETNYWMKMIAALESGAVRYFRIEAVKNS